MMYFTIEQEYNAQDLIEFLIGYADGNSKTILELSQEYQLEEIILDTLDTIISEKFYMSLRTQIFKRFIERHSHLRWVFAKI